MGILLVIAVVNLSATQVKSRNNERKADVEAIAAAMENYYNGSNDIGSTGRYPSLTVTGSESNVTNSLRDISKQSFIAPGSSTIDATFIAATNTTQTTTGVSPQPSAFQYVYQPLAANGGLCTTSATECRKFNIFYRTEGDFTVMKVTSRHQ